MKNKLKVIEIGNSKGLRLGTAILKFLDDPDYLEVELVDDKLVLSKVKEGRLGWEEAFKNASREEFDDSDNKVNKALLNLENDWDLDEWTW
ncbi:MAG: AbrB/MazE/SpoVT family DNA-binding domain-containing protein [Candidatus Caenarcaniphilales bacterium]|nr:AbrB/MazE/SpoVT family DNA-binding domain-containing protein [Candidatus Caenarcaniphilales bacterium]